MRSPTPTDDEPEHAPKAVVDWGECSPRVAEILAWTWTRCYSGWHSSERIRSLDPAEFEALGTLRMDAHDYLDLDEHAELRAIEKSIREIEAGRGPSSVEDTTELDAAWCELLAEHVEEFLEDEDEATEVAD